MGHADITPQKMDFHRAMEVVKDVSQIDPVRGLLWLAAVSGKSGIADSDARVLSFTSELIACQCKLDEAKLHQLYSRDDILEKLSHLPTEMEYRPSPDWLGAPVALSLRTSFGDERLLCHGLGSGTFETPIVPAAWSIVGIALESDGYAATPDRDQARSLLPSTALIEICNRWNEKLDRRAPSMGRGSFNAPIGLFSQAVRDQNGRIHDVSDLLTSKLELDALSWFAQHAIGNEGLDSDQHMTVASGWGMQAARLADLARFEYKPAYASERWANYGLDATTQSNRVSNAIVSIVHAGGHLTSELWGDRFFGDENKREMRALSLAVLDHASLTDEEKLDVLKDLRRLGHDVVVAHRDRREFEDMDPPTPKVYKELPLDVAVQFDLSSCTLALLEWGADAHAPCGDARFSPMQHSLARENDGLAMGVHQILRAHEAKRYADDALAELDFTSGAARP